MSYDNAALGDPRVGVSPSAGGGPRPASPCAFPGWSGSEPNPQGRARAESVLLVSRSPGPTRWERNPHAGSPGSKSASLSLGRPSWGNQRDPPRNAIQLSSQEGALLRAVGPAAPSSTRCEWRGHWLSGHPVPSYVCIMAGSRIGCGANPCARRDCLEFTWATFPAISGLSGNGDGASLR